MSVLERIKSMAGEQGEPMQRFSSPVNTEEAGDFEQMMMSAPIPGQSLTQDPESRLPYEQPPVFTDVQEFIDETFLQLSAPETLPELLDVMRNEVPLEFIAQKYLMTAFKKGQINPDLLMLSIEPTIYILISLATYANIDPVLYPEDEMLEDESQGFQTKYYKQASNELLADVEEDTSFSINDVQAPAVQPRSLLARSQQAVSSINTGG